MSFAWHSHAICMSLVCIRMLFAGHSYVIVCHPYITRMYSYVICMPLVCTRMSSVCHSYVLVCHLYATRMHSHVIRMSLVCTRMSFVCHSYVVLPWTIRLRSVLEMFDFLYFKPFHELRKLWRHDEFVTFLNVCFES